MALRELKVCLLGVSAGRREGRVGSGIEGLAVVAGSLLSELREASGDGGELCQRLERLCGDGGKL